MKNLLLALLILPSPSWADTSFNIVSFQISFGGNSETSKGINLLGYRANLSANANETNSTKTGVSPLLWVGLGAIAAAVAISASDDDKEDKVCRQTGFIVGPNGSTPVIDCPD